MLITATFSSTCPGCGQRITAGTRVEWAKGKPARHTTCPTGASTAARSRASAPRIRSTNPRACQPGEQVIVRKSLGRDDGYIVGDVRHATKVRGEGGGPDKHYWTVVEAGKYQGMDHDDEPEWTCWAIVRPSTDAECAPLVAKIGLAELRAALARELRNLRGERVPGAMPADAVALVPRDPGKLCANGERVAIVDGAILHERVGDPEMLDSWYHYVVRVTDAPADLVERVRAFVASQSPAVQS